jgi:hypothetical protein
MEIFRKDDSAADAISTMNGLFVCAFSRKEVSSIDSLMFSSFGVRAMCGMDLLLW